MKNWSPRQIGIFNIHPLPSLRSKKLTLQKTTRGFVLTFDLLKVGNLKIPFQRGIIEELVERVLSESRSNFQIRRTPSTS